VLGAADGSAAIAVGVHGKLGYVRVAAVAPTSQGTGLGRALVVAAEEWAHGEGADRMQAGAEAPFYLWPGIDVQWTKALCLFESLGYRPVEAELNMSCPTTFRSPPPEGVEVRRVLSDGDAGAVLAFCERTFPHWMPELRRGIDHGACHAAFDPEPIGFACHSVNRIGWVGPMGTDPERRHKRVGAALLSELCKDLRVAGFADAEIAWVGPVGFYARTAGAAVSRTFRVVAKRLGPDTPIMPPPAA
jgi:GNAT superfamily N-acetyltransferase